MPHHGGKFFYFTHILIWGNLAFYFSITMLWILECVPRTKIWNPLVPGHCVNANYAFAITAAINIISDFSILILPLASIWSLQMPTRRKLGVSTVFATGLLLDSHPVRCATEAYRCQRLYLQHIASSVQCSHLQ